MFLNTSTDNNSTTLSRESIACASATKLCMGTLARIEVWHPSKVLAENILDKLFSSLRITENQLSRFIEHSEVSRINREASSRSVIVENDLFNLLLKCREVYRISQRTFDISIGPLMDLWREASHLDQMPSKTQINSALSRIGFDSIVLDESRRSVYFKKRGMRLDLGAIGKGFALNKISNLLDGELARVFVNLGGNIYYHGSESIKVGIRNPMDSQNICGDINVLNQAVSTSSNAESSLEVNGKRLNHIHSPYELMMKNHYLSASVVSEDGALADALSTCFMMVSKEVMQEMIGVFSPKQVAMISKNKWSLSKKKVEIQYLLT